MVTAPLVAVRLGSGTAQKRLSRGPQSVAVARVVALPRLAVVTARLAVVTARPVVAAARSVVVSAVATLADAAGRPPLVATRRSVPSVLTWRLPSRSVRSTRAP